MKKILGTKVIIDEIVREEEREEKTSGGLIIPSSERKARPLAKGKVIGVGLDCNLTKIGNTVFFDENTVMKISMDKQTYLVLEENGLFAIET